VFENRVLRKISGPKRDEVKVEWIRLYNEELYAFVLIIYYSGDQIKKNEMDRACGTYGEEERCTKGFGGET
jgi:hypothetical protein